jgi:hypothetical protein
MTPSIRRKLEALAERHEEIGRLLAEPDALADQKRFRDLSREYAQLEPVTAALARHAAAQRDLIEAETMRADPELREFADEECANQHRRLAALDAELQLLLLPRDPRDEANLYLEVRAGTGDPDPHRRPAGSAPPTSAAALRRTAGTYPTQNQPSRGQIAADEAVTMLPPNPTAKHKRILARLCTLVSKTADQASEALEKSEDMLAQRSAHMAARAAKRPRQPRAR